MSNPEDQFKINLNQNLWGLVVGLGGLGLAEYFHLPTLFWLAVVVSGVMALSIAVTTLAYTVNYWKGKLKPASVGGPPWSIHISGCMRLGIACSGFWMILAVVVYFLGICFYPSFLTNALSKLYTWVERGASVMDKGIAFSPLHPTMDAFRVSLFVFLPVLSGWIVFYVIPRSIRWIRDGFEHERKRNS